MSIYQYEQSHTLDSVRFKRTGNGALRAYLHAAPSASEEGMRTTLAALKQQGFDCIPYMLDGKPTLEVRGMKKEAELNSALHKAGVVEGEPKITQEKEDHITWSEAFKKRSLQLSGGVFMLADLGFMMYGAKEKSWEDTAAGLSYLAGSATFAAYGRNDQSQAQIRDSAQLILDYARNKGLDVGQGAAATDVGRERTKGLLTQVDEFFRKHPSEIGNMAYVVAGGLIAKSALQSKALATPRADMSAEQIRKMRIGGWGDTALGGSTIASGLTATLVKEKAHDPDNQKHDAGLGSVMDWVREKPLRVAGYGYMCSTLCHAITTLVETREAKRVLKDATMTAAEHAHAAQKLKAIPWRALFVSATLVGEILLSISSKGHGEGVQSDNTIDNSVVALTADLISKQPKHLQPQLIQEMAQFLGRPEVLATKDSDVTKQLQEQVQLISDNPWSRHMVSEHAANEKPVQENSAVRPRTLAADKSMVPAWQAKLRRSENNSADMPLPG